VRAFLLFLFPSILAAQTLQFAAVFGGSCESLECDTHGWYPDTVTSIAVDSAGNTYLAGTSFGEFPLVNAIEASPYQLLIDGMGDV
jgi:hypothetical protein